jgi:hypothetical protein
MEWPIRISEPGAEGKCENDAQDYYYKQGKRDQGVPGDMYRRMGWWYSQRPLEEMPFKSGLVWWKWGN